MTIRINSRLRGLIETLEADKDLTQQQLRRACQLQALDTLIAGEDYVNEFCQRNDDFTQQFKQLLDS